MIGKKSLSDWSSQKHAQVARGEKIVQLEMGAGKE